MGNISEGHRHVRRNMDIVSDLLIKNKEHPDLYAQTVYPNTLCEGNIGPNFSEQGHPPVPPEVYAWDGVLNMDLSYMSKFMGSTGAGGTYPSDVAPIQKRWNGEPLLFCVKDPNNPNDLGRQRFLHVMSSIVKPYITNVNPQFDAVFASEQGMLSRLIKYYDANDYAEINADMSAERERKAQELGFNLQEVEDVNALPEKIKKAFFSSLKKYANSKKHGFYKFNIPLAATEIMYDNMHPYHNHGAYHTSTFLMVVYDFCTIFTNRYPTVPEEDTDHVWGARTGTPRYNSICHLRGTLPEMLTLISEFPRLHNVAAKAAKKFKEEGDTITASKLIFRFDNAFLNEFFNQMFKANNLFMELIEIAAHLHPEAFDEWVLFKETCICLFWDLILFREMSILGSASELTLQQLDLMVTGGIDKLANYRVVGLRVPYNMRCVGNWSGQGYYCYSVF